MAQLIFHRGLFQKHGKCSVWKGISPGELNSPSPVQLSGFLCDRNQTHGVCDVPGHAWEHHLPSQPLCSPEGQDRALQPPTSLVLFEKSRGDEQEQPSGL